MPGNQTAGSVVVLGGTGFVGARVARALVLAGGTATVAARHPEGAAGVNLVAADIRDRQSLARAFAGAAALVNCVSLYRESRKTTFEEIHVRGARRTAEVAAELGLRRLVHISGIGADPSAADSYIRARGRGEAAVREAMPEVVIVRPSAMFARHGGLLATLGDIVRRAPVVPLFGRGATRLQPVFVDDVAAALARLAIAAAPRPVYELGGPDIFTYRALVERLARQNGRSPLLLPVPFALWHVAAFCLRPVPGAPITPAQVALMLRQRCGRGLRHLRRSTHRTGLGGLARPPLTTYSAAEALRRIGLRTTTRSSVHPASAAQITARLRKKPRFRFATEEHRFFAPAPWA